MFRTKLRNTYLKNPNEVNCRDYKKQRNHCVKLLNQAKKNYYENLNPKLITDNRKFWKAIKPTFSGKTITSSNYILYDEEKIVDNENEVAEKCNHNLGTDDNESYNTDSVNLSDPVNMAINKYSNHPSIIAIKTNCLTDTKHSFSAVSLQDIQNIVRSIDVSKATASNSIPAGLFKDNIDLYIDIVTNIVNKRYK